MQIPIVNGIYTNQAGDFRTRYPRNLVPVPKQTGASDGYLKPADGIAAFATGPGVDRGGFNWNGVCYRVMGTKLVTVSGNGVVTVLGEVGEGGPVTMDNGFDRLAIWSAGRLYYFDGSLTQVTDPDLGTVIDGRWIAGYYLSTDGTNLIVTELNDPYAVNPLKYGSVESDPDRILAVDELRNELYALGRYTIEVFNNVGGSGFPFSRIEGAQIVRGVIGTYAYSQFAQSFAFLGSGKNEAPAVYVMGAGSTEKISTREIDQVLLTYTEAQLSGVVVECKVHKGHNWLLMHLPDTTWVYDYPASQAIKEQVWFELNSGIETLSTYRARHLTWCYDKWICGDPTNAQLGVLTEESGGHFGDVVGWEFGTMMLYNESRGAIVHNLELVALPGRVPVESDAVVWTSYSLDGETWSQELPTPAGKMGERLKRIAWRRQGKMRNYRMQKFRGTSEARVSFARLEAVLEPLNG